MLTSNRCCLRENKSLQKRKQLCPSPSKQPLPKKSAFSKHLQMALCVPFENGSFCKYHDILTCGMLSQEVFQSESALKHFVCPEIIGGERLISLNSAAREYIHFKFITLGENQGYN